MGSYNFRWEHPAEEVYVTGTFDDWKQSVKLDKRHLVHEKLVGFSTVPEKIFFKYVVDSEWKLDPTHPTEEDHHGNTNNVLYPDEIGPPMANAHPVISSVAPGASSTAMAGQQPLLRRQTEDISDVPGAFPETPALTAGDDEKKDGLAAAAGVGGIAAVGAAVLGTAATKDNADGDQTVSVNPIPASEGAGNPVHLAPGEKVPDPATINSNTVTSGVHDDPSLMPGSSEPTFGVAPIPASAGTGNPIRLAPGEKVPDPATINNNTIASGVHDDLSLQAREEPTFRATPIPATGGIGNPVHLQPGEPVPDPSTITSNTLDTNVKLDQASYEKSDASPPVLPPPLSPQSEAEAGGAPIFGLLGSAGPQTTNIIPESSLPMGRDMPPPIDQANTGPNISSVAPTSTTNQLAGQVPLEPRGVPEVVTESQQQAHVDPEAAANPTAVEQKREVEDELKSKVPEEQSSGTNKAGVAAAVGGGLAAVGAAAITTAAALREKTHEATGTDPVSVLPQSVQDSINNATGKPATGTATESTATTANAVPSIVKDSQQAAHVDPEASANPTAVQEKAATENELLSKVQASQEAGEPAPTATAATSATAPVAHTSSTGAPQLGNPIVGGGLAPISMDEKPVTGSSELNAPATAAAQTGKPPVSRDVSPRSKPATAAQTQPTVTTGVDSSKAPAVSSPTPNKKRHSFFGGKAQVPSDSQSRPGTAGTDGVASRKKKGFFAKIKEKLSHHN